MMDARRLGYLEAMGIDVWQPRRTPLDGGPVESLPHIQLGHGDGDILCLAPDAGKSASKLATDISRAMRNPPVWAWPTNEGGTTVPGVIAERLLTRVLIFGEELASALFRPSVPEVIAGARIHVVPGLERLGRDREAKRILWAMMIEHGVAAQRGPGRSPH